MSNEAKVNLKNVLTALTIVIMAAAVIGAAYIAYDDTKEAKVDIAAITVRMNTVELKQERFEGIIEERTRNTQEDVKTIMSDMKILLHRLELDNNG